MDKVTSGEGYLALTHPIYKRRYAVSTDLMLGCRIGCEFCYYRFGPTAPYFHRNARLKPLASPAQYWRALRDSLVVNPGDLVIVSARSDMSMPEHYAAFRRFLEEHYDPTEKPLTFLMLQRGVYTARRWREMAAFPVIFGTTITPEAARKGFNAVVDSRQIRGLLEMRGAGTPADRISLELGPILPDTVGSAVETAVYLHDRGAIEFLTYRGASVGQYGDYRAAIDNLVSKGFLKREDLERGYTYFDGREDVQHEYYLVKNFLAPAVERAFREGVQERAPGLRVYRHTGHLYPREFGISVAANRNNRVRDEMLQYADASLTVERVRETLSDAFGMDAPVEKQGAAFLIRAYGTEDMAHAIGARLRTAVLFSQFSNQPTVQDVHDLYFPRGWLAELDGRGGDPANFRRI